MIATVSGETQVTTQLAVEQAEMIRAGKIRPLAVLSDKPLEIEGFGTVPPLTDTVKDFPVAPNYFGIFVPKGVPDEVVQTLDMVWKDKIASSAALQKYANSRGAQFAGNLYGEAAQKAVEPAVRTTAWLLFDGGKAKVSPDTVGIAEAVSRADLAFGSLLIALGLGIVALSWQMPRFADQGVNPWSVPGLVPGILGVVILILALALVGRSIRRLAAAGGAGDAPGPLTGLSLARIALTLLLTLVYAAGLVGHLPFWLATFLFVAAFVFLFELGSGRRRLGSAVAAVVIGGRRVRAPCRRSSATSSSSACPRIPPGCPTASSIWHRRSSTSRAPGACSRSSGRRFWASPSGRCPA